MDKTFDPKAVEGRIAAAWQKADAFRANRPDRAQAEPFTIAIPPPNVTGSLHMGHALNITLQDILCRFERMRGKNVLWQPGTDHAGIATQMVVERQLMESQEPGRHVLGREKFLERVWQWKSQSGGAIVDQLQRLGASCDWSRERFTLGRDETDQMSRAVIRVFVELYNEKLIYKDKRLVNWDPELQTAISDLEVKQVEIKGHLWYFRYPLLDKTFDATDPSTHIVVATTRPETMLGDTAVAVHPSDERYKHLQGKKVRLPLVGRLIPIIADEYSDPEKGTGAVKITPAHDFNDFEVGKRHGLRQINILNAEAQVSIANNTDFLLDLSDDKDAYSTIDKLNGLPREVARTKIVEMMDTRCLLDKIEPHAHMVPYGDRSGAVIEPWLTDQWYVDAKALAQPAIQAVREGKTRFIPENWEKTYFQWLENVQPWCISRQLWWGHQIPVWYGPQITDDGALSYDLGGGSKNRLFAAISECDAVDQAQRAYGKPVKVLPWRNLVTDDIQEMMEGQTALIWRDPDVLDTWFSSALWPFSTLGWPEEPPELKYRYPTNVLITGFDIIFFWVARMMMMGLHFMRDVPFRDVYIHALVRDEKGAKMSKSKGNVVDPLELIDTFGADALRFTLAAMAAQGRDIKLSMQRIEGYRNFGTKLWNAARFAELNGCVLQASFDPRQTILALNCWIIGETARTIAEVTAAIKAYRFNDAANAAYKFVWNIFCDWYLELAKPLLQGSDGPGKFETRATTAFVREQIIKLLHPFMPFITEELWAITAPKEYPRASLLALAQWPDLDYQNPTAEAEIGFIVELISEIRSVRAEINVPAAAQIPLVLVNAPVDIRSHVENWGGTVKRLARLTEISFSAKPPESSVQLLVRKAVAALSLQGVVDFRAEWERLRKEIVSLSGEVAKLEAKLNNRVFVARAPEEIVEETRGRLVEALSRKDKLIAARARFVP